jgi:hypothetical protein
LQKARKIIKFYQECKELNSQTDGYYYYDPDKKAIAFLMLTNNGNFSVGNVKEEKGKIIEYGQADAYGIRSWAASARSRAKR